GMGREMKVAVMPELRIHRCGSRGLKTNHFLAELWVRNENEDRLSLPCSGSQTRKKLFDAERATIERCHQGGRRLRFRRRRLSDVLQFEHSIIGKFKYRIGSHRNCSVRRTSVRRFVANYGQSGC